MSQTYYTVTKWQFYLPLRSNKM